MTQVTKKVLHYAPNLLIRLGLWFFIYLGAQVLLMVRFYAEAGSNGGSQSLPNGEGVLLFLLVFRFGLWPSIPYFGHIFYLCHLIYSLIIRWQTLYFIGLSILVGALFINVVSCTAMNGHRSF